MVSGKLDEAILLAMVCTVIIPKGKGGGLEAL